MFYLREQNRTFSLTILFYKNKETLKGCWKSLFIFFLLDRRKPPTFFAEKQKLFLIFTYAARKRKIRDERWKIFSAFLKVGWEDLDFQTFREGLSQNLTLIHYYIIYLSG